MGEILSVALDILARSASNVEISGRNLVSGNIAGYRRAVSFNELVDADARDAVPQLTVRRDFGPGKYMPTDNPLDLAIEGEGLFMLRAGEAMVYGRGGAFHRDGNNLVDARGHVVQAEAGGDLALGEGPVEVLSDGTVMTAGIAAGRFAIVDFADRAGLSTASGELFSGPVDQAAVVEHPRVRQGMLESSNVSTGDEMVRMMAALRAAETGQRLVQTYDDLMGRAISAFGSNG